MGGQTSEAGAEIQWALPNSEIYHAERWGSFKYQIPLPSTDDSQYTLILKFSEIYFQEPNQKVFNVRIGSQVVIRELDIFSKLLSRGIPYDEFIDVRVKNGKVSVNGQEASDALKNGKLIIDFVQGKADNPKVNGILLVQGGKENTHWKSFQNYLKAIEDLKNQQMKEREQQDIAMTQRLSSFDYFADDEDPSSPKSPINSILSKPYLLEAFSFGFIALFFGIVNGIGK